MVKDITHEEWIRHLENLCLQETGKQVREGDPIFENWLRETSVDEVLQLLKRVTK